MPDKTYRAFFAITLPQADKIELNNWQDSLFEATSIKPLRWVKAEKIHLTLQFIEHLQNEKLLKLTQVVSSQLSIFKIFTLQTSLTTHLFPSNKNPKCLILKITPEATIVSLSEVIGKAMQEIDLIPEKRRFKPHITLAKFETSPLMIPTLQLPKPIQFKVTEVVLLQSQTYQDGAIYNLLERFSLQY